MSHLLSVGEICDRALRKIGAYPTRSSGARADDSEEARYWLDLVVAHEAARSRMWWLVPSAATFPLVSGTASYDLSQQLGGSQAPNGIASVVSIILYNADTGADIHSVPMLRRQEFEARNLPQGGTHDSPWEWSSSGLGMGASSETTGTPTICHIDRAQAPTIRFAPTPDDGLNYGVRVVFQGYSEDFVRASVDQRTLSLRSSWYMWLVTALAAELGDGPVRKLPADEVRDMKQDARGLRGDLEAYDAEETATTSGVVRYHDF
jgi:hypothetical protein